MSITIHLFAERLKDGAWQSIDRWEPRTDMLDEHLFRVASKDQFLQDGHSYISMALAGMGIRPGVKPIDQPRGMPSNVSMEVVRYATEEQPGKCYGYSWLLLSELERYEWFDVPGSACVRKMISKLKRFGKCGQSHIRVVFWFS